MQDPETAYVKIDLEPYGEIWTYKIQIHPIFNFEGYVVDYSDFKNEIENIIDQRIPTRKDVVFIKKIEDFEHMFEQDQFEMIFD